MNIKSFEDLKVWQSSRELVKLIYTLTNSEKFKIDYGFKDQIQRASISILNNIAEGYERNNNKEFIKFLGYSKGSAGELRAMLYVALDLNYISNKEFNSNYNNVINISMQLSSFIRFLRKDLETFQGH